MQAAEDMIVRTQDHLQALTVVDAKAKKQQEADCTRSLSLVRAEKEAHDRYSLSWVRCTYILVHVVRMTPHLVVQLPYVCL